MSKSLADIEKYATDYMIFRDIGDLGMSGSLHYWSVELDRTQILALTQKLTLDLSGTGMTEQASTELKKNLETLSFSGKIGYDPADPRVSVLDGALSVSGALIAQIRVAHTGDDAYMQITNVDDTGMVLHYNTKNNRYTFDAAIRESGNEVRTMSGYIDRTGDKFKELSIEASAKGITASLKHTVDGDNFVGKLSAVVGTIEWSGKIQD